MDIADLIEISLAGIDPNRVAIASLEPASVSPEIVSELSSVVAELAENATAFSGPEQVARVNGVFADGDYLISVSDDGVGISEGMLTALNRILDNPAPAPGPGEMTLGITVVARLAAKHGIGVRLIPGVPGTTARVTIPRRLVSVPDRHTPENDGPSDASRMVSALRENQVAVADEPPRPAGDDSASVMDPAPPTFDASPTPHVVSMSETARREAEVFLETVFGPLRGRSPVVDRPRSRAPASTGRGRDAQVDSRPPVEHEPRAAPSTLRVRVPGTNFSMLDDEPSTLSSEAAIDIRSALSRYELGRRQAVESRGDESGPA